MKNIVLFLIRCYQVFISPLLGGHCRFYPSCSSYTYQAIKKHGFLKGVFLGGKRLLKCHPFHPGGVDLIP
jgi:putative membrane protein insertion efficiency factor